MIARPIAVFLAWNLAVSAAVLAAPPLVGLGVVLVATGVVIQFYLLRGPRPRRRWALLRLRAPSPEALRWTLVGIPVLLLSSWALGSVYVHLVPVPPDSFDPFGRLMGTAQGRLTITVLAVAVAPIMEEFFFRGLLQRSLERRWGAAAGIGGAALLFALIHLIPWILPLHLFLGLAFGYAVYATRSIWPGVLLHAANNVAAVVGMGLVPEEERAVRTIWETGPTADWWISLGWLLLAGLLLARTARGLWAAGQPSRLRGAGAEG